jgi:tetratricopeptide (TPR) repeat protein
MSQTVTCPHCRTLLRSQKPIPAGVTLHCPDCHEPFLAPAVIPALPTGPKLIGPPFLIAVTVSLLLGASIIIAALLITARRPVEVVQEPRSDSEGALARQQKELADAEKRLEEKSRAMERNLEHARLLDRAEAALEKGKYVDAKKFFTQALELKPDDGKARAGLVQVEVALASAARTEKDEKKLKAEIDQLLADAKKALEDRKFAVAMQRLEAARGVAPTNKAVLDLLAEAQTALDADRNEKKKLVDFRTHMDAGKAALKAERYPDAVKEYMAALRLMPDDLEAQNGQKQAEAKIAALADKEKRQNAFAALMDRARVALGAKRFNEAIQNLEAALRLIPDDRDAVRDLRDAKAALTKAKKANASLLARADEALKVGRATEARDLCDEAVKNWAEDSKAEKALQTVQRLLDNAKTAQANVQATLAARLQAAQLLYTNGNYAGALTAYQLLAQQYPSDLVVLRWLRKVERAVAVDKLLRAGDASMRTLAYGDAIAYYRRALRLDRDNVDAVAGLAKARYNKAMADGRLAMLQRRKNDAIAAYTAALDANPGDVAASNYLRQARAMR